MQDLEPALRAKLAEMENKTHRTTVSYVVGWGAAIIEILKLLDSRKDTDAG